MYPLYKDEKDFELYRRRSVHIGPHLHKSLELVLVLEGSLELGIGQELYHMEKGDLGLVFPELIHHYQVFDTNPCRSLYLLASPVMAGPYQKTLQQLCPENPVIPAKKVHADVAYALETLTGRRKKKPEDDVIRQAYLTIILARTLPLLKLIEKPTPGDGDLIYRTVGERHDQHIASLLQQLFLQGVKHAVRGLSRAWRPDDEEEVLGLLYAKCQLIEAPIFAL